MITAVETQLRERRKQVWKQASDMISAADGRSLTRAERDTWLDYERQLDVLDQRIASVIRTRVQVAPRLRTCSYCRRAAENGRQNCRNCGAPLEGI